MILHKLFQGVLLECDISPYLLGFLRKLDFKISKNDDQKENNGATLK